MRRAWLWWALGSILIGGLAWSQESATTGSLFGRVTDPQGKPLPGVAVTAVSETGVSRQALTDDNGEFAFPFLTPGQYEVFFSLTGFAPYKVPVTVALGQRTSLQVTLRQEEVVEVVATPVVDVTSASAGVAVTDTLMRSVPVGRSFASAAYIGVMATSGFGAANPSIGGATGLENTYIVEGLSITNAGYGALGAYSIQLGSMGSAIPFDFVKEVQVKSGGFEPEYGEALGGVISIITKSGGNQLAGDVFAYWRPAALEGSRKHTGTTFAPEVYTKGITNWDVGLAVGGRLVQDRLFWFLAFDPTQDRITRVAPPDFPLANLGDVTSTRWTFPYSGKLTWNVSADHIIEATAFGDPGRMQKGLWFSQAFLASRREDAELGATFGGHNALVRWTGLFGAHFLAEATVGYHYDAIRNRDFLNQDSIQDNRGPQVVLKGGLQGRLIDGTSRIPQAIAKLTYIVPQLLGRHEFKVGAQWQRIEWDHTWIFPGTPKEWTYIKTDTGERKAQRSTTGHQIFIDRIDDPAVCARVGLPAPCAQFTLYRDGHRTSPNALATRGTYLSWFAQDSWNPIPNLTLKLGVRWDRQTLKGAGAVGQEMTISDQWAPRLGFVWDFLNDRKGKVFGYYGWFFEKIPMDIAARSLSSETNIEIRALAPFDTPAEAYYEVLNDLSRQIFAGEYGAVGIPEYVCDGKPGFDVAGNRYDDDPACMGVRLKGQYVGEWMLGLERQVWKNLVVSARFQRRWIGRVIEDIQMNAHEDIVAGRADFGTWVITNPSDKLVCREPIYDPTGFLVGCSSPGQLFPKPERNYTAFEITVTKRYSDNWQLIASYRWSRLRGFYAGYNWRERRYTGILDELGQPDPNITGLFDFPCNPDLFPDLKWTCTSGPLFADRTHVFRVYGSYTLPMGLNLGAGVAVESGTPMGRLGALIFYPPGTRYVGPRGGLGRTDAIFNVDLHADYTFKLTQRNRLTLILDVFNVFNQQAATDKDTVVEFTYGQYKEGMTDAQIRQINPDYLKPRFFSPPFAVRLGARLSF